MFLELGVVAQSNVNMPSQMSTIRFLCFPVETEVHPL